MILLVDYSSLLYRAYHSTPSTVPFNAIHGTLTMLTRLILDRKPDRVVLATDADWRPEFRVQALPMYKAQRVSDEPDPVTPQEIAGREVLDALGFAVVGADGYEGEDIIATIAARVKGDIEIYSGDRDLFALVEDPHVRVLYPAKGGLQVVDEAWITAKYGIPGRRYGDFAILRGDPSDGLPGVPGIGEKTAARLINENPTMDDLLKVPKVASARDYFEAARRVVLPVTNAPIPAGGDYSLPKTVRHEDVLEKKYADLSGAITRTRSALGI